MVAALGDTASSYATVKSWAAHFKMGKGGGGGGLEVNDRCGQHTHATTEENMCTES